MMQYFVVIFLVAGCASAGQPNEPNSLDAAVVDAANLECNQGESQMCTEADGCDGEGVRACDGGMWGPCRDPEGTLCECEEGLLRRCTQNNGQPGSQRCEDGIWTECARSGG